MERRITILGNKDAAMGKRKELIASIRRALPKAHDILFICTTQTKKKAKVCVMSGITPEHGMAVHNAVQAWDRKAGMELSKAITMMMIKKMVKKAEAMKKEYEAKKSGRIPT